MWLVKAYMSPGENLLWRQTILLSQSSFVIVVIAHWGPLSCFSFSAVLRFLLLLFCSVCVLCDLQISHGQFGCLGEEVCLYPPLLSFLFMESLQRPQDLHFRSMDNHFHKSLLFSFSSLIFSRRLLLDILLVAVWVKHLCRSTKLWLRWS